MIITVKHCALFGVYITKQSGFKIRKSFVTHFALSSASNKIGLDILIRVPVFESRMDGIIDKCTIVTVFFATQRKKMSSNILCLFCSFSDISASRFDQSPY